MVRFLASNVATELLGILFLFEMSRVQILAPKPAILTEDFHGVPKPVQVDGWQNTLNKTTTDLFHVLSIQYSLTIIPFDESQGYFQRRYINHTHTHLLS